MRGRLAPAAGWKPAVRRIEPASISTWRRWAAGRSAGGWIERNGQDIPDLIIIDLSGRGRTAHVPLVSMVVESNHGGAEGAEKHGAGRLVALQRTLFIATAETTQKPTARTGGARQRSRRKREIKAIARSAGFRIARVQIGS